MHENLKYPDKIKILQLIIEDWIKQKEKTTGELV